MLESTNVIDVQVTEHVNSIATDYIFFMNTIIQYKHEDIQATTTFHLSDFMKIFKQQQHFNFALCSNVLLVYF
jgi:hypothetical protein